jgi:hypothetical protein
MARYQKLILTTLPILSILASMFLSSCSSRIDYADVARKEQMIIDRVQKLPSEPIDGVTYSMQKMVGYTPDAVLMAEFASDGVKYTIATPAITDINGRTSFFFQMIIEDGKKTVGISEVGNTNQPGVGVIDGDLDAGSIEENGKREEFNRYWVESDVKGKLEKYEVQAIEVALKALKLN